MSQVAEQLTFNLGHRSALGRDDFMISSANQDAVAWIDKWPKWPAPTLVIYGPAACGKSHLAAVWGEKSRAACIRADDLACYEADKIAECSEHLIINYADAWIGDKDAETTLFHLYNLMKEEGRSLLLTMRSSPIHLSFFVPDLASRLRASPAAAIHPPDDPLLASILVKLFSDRQINIGTEVLSYILPRMERSFSAARDLADKADKLALAQKRPVSIPLIRQILLSSSVDQ